MQKIQNNNKRQIVTQETGGKKIQPDKESENQVGRDNTIDSKG